jgi:hypothetical protein
MQEREDARMKKHTCVAAIIACVALLLTACTPPPVERLNQQLSNENLRMTATDMCVESCPINNDYIVVTTYFTIKNTSFMRTIKPSVKSGWMVGPGNNSDFTSFHLDDLRPRKSLEFYVTMTAPADAVEVRHLFYSNRKENVAPASRFWLAIST